MGDIYGTHPKTDQIQNIIMNIFNYIENESTPSRF